MLLATVAASSGQFTSTPGWADEFSNTGAPDTSKWGYETGGGGWGNSELQNYTARPENARVENGALVINARQENYGGNSFTSARLHSQGLGDWKYGRIEVRARFTGAAGTWPAIWMLPTDWVYGNWPGSGEIDMMEHVSTHGTSVQASVHTDAYNFKINTARIGFQGGIDHWNWHTYALEWFPHRLDISVDGIRFFSFRDEYGGWTKWPFDQRFHLMLNIAVGGWGGTPNFTSETMEIDHVRVFPYTNASQVPVASAQWFRLVNRQSGKVLDVAGPSNADGANIHQWEWFGTTSQQWRFEPTDDGCYKIINRFSGKLPDTAGGSWSNGANVQQWADVGTPQQQWWLQPTGDGYYKLVNRETGRVMELVYNQTANGGNIQQWDYVGGANQQWRVEPLGTTAPATPTGFSAHVRDEATTLSWNAVAGASGYRVKRAIQSAGPFTDISADISATTFDDASRAAGIRYFYQVVACVASDESAPSAAINVAPVGLPPHWVRSDIGAVGAVGAANFLDGNFVLEGSGADIWDTADECRFASVEMNGDGAVIARVDSLGDTDPWAKAGVMIRESSAPGAKHAMMALTPGNGAQFLTRTTTGGTTTSSGAAAAAPCWVKLVRSGNTFTGYRSPNGSAWTQVGSATIAMSTRVLAGLAVTSHNDAVLNTAIFSKVTVLPAGWTDQEVGAPPLTGAASFSADGEWMVAGSGADIAGTADQFHFVVRDFTGDGTLTARVTSVETTNLYAKAGVMFRESDTADARYAFAFAGPGTVGFECRTATGATMTAVGYIGNAAPVWVRLTRGNGIFAASYSTDGTAWTALGTPAALTMTASARAGMAVTSHDAGEVCECTFESVSLLPATWNAGDIGVPGIPGATTFNTATGAWSLTGSGADIWGTGDQLQLASQSLTGDGVIVARVKGLANTDPWAKAGIMMRESTAPDARNVILLTSAANGINLQSRGTPGGATANWTMSASTSPLWLRVARSGNTITAAQSNDGSVWINSHSIPLALGNTVVVGLAVTSHDNGNLNAATFDNVSVTALPAGTSSWGAFQQAWFNAGQLANPTVSDPTADANRDGLANLFAYGSGIDPWLQATATNGGRPVVELQGGYQMITFTRLKMAFDFSYTVEVSGNLTTWNSGAAYTTQTDVTSLDTVRERVTVRDNIPVSSATRRYIRLRGTYFPQ